MQISPSPGTFNPEIRPKPAHPESVSLTSGQSESVLMDRARDLEATFLSEMLAYAGLGKMPEGGFGGGIGEDQFGSFLRQEQAAQMVQRGGIGLAEQLFHAMTRGAA